MSTTNPAPKPVFPEPQFLSAILAYAMLGRRWTLSEMLSPLNTEDLEKLYYAGKLVSEVSKAGLDREGDFKARHCLTDLILALKDTKLTIQEITTLTPEESERLSNAIDTFKELEKKFSQE